MSDSRDAKLDGLYKKVEKEYAEGILGGASHLIDNPPRVISVTPRIDGILGGGVPEGVKVNLAGPEKSGKSSLALTIAAQCQRPENGSRHVFYGDVEHRLKKMNLTGIKGLDTSAKMFSVIQSKPGKILSGKDHLRIYADILMDYPECVLVIDSISTLSEDNELTEGVDAESRGGGAKILSRFLRTVQSVVPLNKSILIGICHIICNTSGWGPPKIERGGTAWRYHSDIRLTVKKVEPWMSKGKEGDRIGQICTWQCLCSALGPPGGECESYLRYGVGFDRLTEAITVAVDLGLIRQAGAWYTLEYLQCEEKPPRFQGLEKVYGSVSANPNWEESLYKAIREKYFGSSEAACDSKA